MKFLVTRNIYFHSPETGLVSTELVKEVESDLPPAIGYKVEDSAWHRNDTPKIESVTINTESGQCWAELEPIATSSADEVARVAEIALRHPGWKTLSDYLYPR